MIIEKLSEVINEIYGDNDSAILVYASETNSNAMGKVVGVQLKKSYADNGDMKSWVEIIYSNEEGEWRI